MESVGWVRSCPSHVMPCQWSPSWLGPLCMAAWPHCPLPNQPPNRPNYLQIVDSLTANFRTDFVGRGELADRQQKIGQMMSRLKKVGGHGPSRLLSIRVQVVLGCNRRVAQGPVKW